LCARGGAAANSISNGHCEFPISSLVGLFGLHLDYQATTKFNEYKLVLLLNHFFSVMFLSLLLHINAFCPCFITDMFRLLNWHVHTAVHIDDHRFGVASHLLRTSCELVEAAWSGSLVSRGQLIN